MGQERFADIVERFTYGSEATPVSPEVIKRWQEEIERARLRMKNFARMIADPVARGSRERPRP